MGILNEMVICNAATAASYVEQRDHPSTDVTVYDEFGGLTGLELSELFCALEGVPFDGDRHDLIDVMQTMPDEDGEQGVLQFPDAMVELLARLSDDDIAVVASRWSAESEGRIVDEAADGLINELRPLAQEALSTNRQLHLWWSL